MTAWVNRDLIRIKIASVYARVPAKAGARRAPSGRVRCAALRGRRAVGALGAARVLDANVGIDRSASLRARASAAQRAVPIVPPATLVYGDCTITIAGDEAYVRRGADRLRIPPRVQFYRAADLLALIRETPPERELRVYEPAQR